MNDNAKMWVKALREAESKYVRGPLGYLKTIDTSGTILSHSPLGIACELAKEAGVVFEEYLGPKFSYIESNYYILDGKSDIPPKSVYEWLGIKPVAEDLLCDLDRLDMSFFTFSSILTSEDSDIFSDSHPTKRNALLWIRELKEFGHLYKPSATGLLKYVFINNKQVHHSPLGVACEVAKRNDVFIYEKTFNVFWDDSNLTVSSFNDQTIKLPWSVIEWLGIKRDSTSLIESLRSVSRFKFSTIGTILETEFDKFFE